MGQLLFSLVLMPIIWGLVFKYLRNHKKWLLFKDILLIGLALIIYDSLDNFFNL